jgi:hypothetical protein
MPAPLVGLAVGAAARAIAKKVASNAVKSGTTRARLNSAEAAKAIAPKKSNAPVKIAKRVTLPGQPIKINTNPKPVVVPAIPLPRSTGGITGPGAKSVNPVYRNQTK